MSTKAPKPPTVLDYEQPPGERRRLPLEVIAFRFVLGAGISTLGSALWLLSARGGDYPPTLACGGTFVVVIQVGLLALASSVRHLATGAILQERHRSTTIVVGMVCAAIVFALPPIVSRVASTNVASIIATILPLCGGPVLASFVVFRRSADKAR